MKKKRSGGSSDATDTSSSAQRERCVMNMVPAYIVSRTMHEKILQRNP